jgi:hypothetical protein
MFVLGEQAWVTDDTEGQNICIRSGLGHIKLENNIFVLGEQAWGTDDTKGKHVYISNAYAKIYKMHIRVSRLWSSGL